MTTVALIVASPIDIEAIVYGDDPPNFVSTYAIQCVKCVGCKPFGGKDLYLLHMIQPEGDALQKARDIFDAQNIDIMAMQRWKREQTGVDGEGNPIYEVVSQKKVNRLAIRNYIRKIWQYDENGQPIPGTDTWPSQFPHVWAGQENWVEE